MDGYTLIYSYPGTQAFVNLKVEQSNEQDYENDKKVILANENYLLSTGKYTDQKQMELVKVNGVEMYSFARNTLDAGNVTAQNILFEDKSKKVITIYFLNHKPEKRKAQTLEEFHQLRDKFLESFTKCVMSREP